MNRKASHDCLRVTRPSHARRVVSEMKHLPAWRTSVSAILVWLAVTGGLPFLKADTPIPAYLSETEAAKPLPATLPPERFSRPEINRAYMVAKRIPRVIAQQPMLLLVQSRQAPKPVGLLCRSTCGWLRDLHEGGSARRSTGTARQEPNRYSGSNRPGRVAHDL